MRPAIPSEEVKVLDINASYLGVRTVNLMERAGQAVANYVIGMAKPDHRVAIVCGKGNNGGDGLVAARYISKSLHVEIFLVEEITSDIARYNLEAVRDLVRPLQLFSPKMFDVIVDAMLGVGLEGKPREPYHSLIKTLNGSRRILVSIDVPSGWPSEVSIRPDTTVTFHAPKQGMTKENSGKITVADIGIPPEAELYCGPGDFALLPRRKKDAHKGDAGRVMVVGGGPFTGAPAFTGMSAMRSGADLTFVLTPESAALPVSIYSPNLIVRPLKGDLLLPEHVGGILDFSREADVIAIGPGLGRDPDTVRAVQEIIRRATKPLVIDADAIGACGAKPYILRGKVGVITPHAGEFKRLTGKDPSAEDIDKRSAMVREEAARLKMTLLLKGPIDVISDGKYVKRNRIHNDAMTVGGTGDVLTGIVAGMLGQKAAPFAAARIGAFTCGLAGNLVFEEKSYGLLPTDIIEKIPFVLRRYL